VACYLTLGQVQQALESVWAAKAGPLLDLRSAATTVDAGTLVLFESAKAGIQRWREQERAHRRKAMDALQREQYERADYHTQRVRAAAAEAQHSELALTTALRTLGGRDGQAAIPTLSEVQPALAPGTALLEYIECGDELLCFLIQQHRPPIYQNLGACQALIPLLERWMLMDGAVPAGADQYREAVLAPLWETLLAPWQQALAATTTLLIAPCGLLYHVPWAALWNGTSYLRDELTILLTPSGAMWAAPWDFATPPPGPPRLLSYAGSGKRQLAYVTAEIAAIARHLPDTQVSLEATAADLRAEPAPRLLHIAAHGYTNANLPVCSTLELADGPFLLLEAHRLNLRGTQLVVLSACETSVRPDYGDMALVLAGAFLCAGAQYVLASLWSVSDAATAALMERFYAAFVAGAAPAEALREAQRQLAYTHPLDWAAFQIWIGAC
jgi:CHAT domain-containing protein